MSGKKSESKYDDNDNDDDASVASVENNIERDTALNLSAVTPTITKNKQTHSTIGSSSSSNAPPGASPSGSTPTGAQTSVSGNIPETAAGIVNDITNALTRVQEIVTNKKEADNATYTQALTGLSTAIGTAGSSVPPAASSSAPDYTPYTPIPTFAITKQLPVYNSTGVFKASTPATPINKSYKLKVRLCYLLSNLITPGTPGLLETKAPGIVIGKGSIGFKEPGDYNSFIEDINTKSSATPQSSLFKSLLDCIELINELYIARDAKSGIPKAQADQEKKILQQFKTASFYTSILPVDSVPVPTMSALNDMQKFHIIYAQLNKILLFAGLDSLQDLTNKNAIKAMEDIIDYLHHETIAFAQMVFDNKKAYSGGGERPSKLLRRSRKQKKEQVDSEEDVQVSD